MECFASILILTSLWLIVRDILARERIRSVERGLEEHQKALSRYQEMLVQLKRDLRTGQAPAEEAPDAAPVTATEATTAARPVPMSVPIPVPVPPPVQAAPPPPEEKVQEDGKKEEETETVLPSPIPPPEPIPAPAPEPSTPAALPVPPVPPVPPVRSAPTFPAAPPRPPKPAFDWENLIGVRLFSWMAGIMLAIAAILFLRYSIQNGWLSAPVRMAIGILTGVGLLVVCELKAARRYAVTANALDASGIAILFATIFASHSLWNLLGATPAFLLMALVAAVAVGLAIRRDSPFIAVLGLLGGFATPALLSTGQDRPIGLFGYLLLLNAGLAWVSLHRRWTVLIRLALAFTVLYQWAWVLRYLDPGRVLLAMGIFLIFPLLYLVAPLLVRRDEAEDRDRGFWQVVSISAGLPLLLAFYLGSSAEFGAHFGLLFGYLLLLGAGLAIFAAVRGPEMLHVAGAGATVAVWCVWLATSYSSPAWPELLAFLSAAVLLYLAAPWISLKMGGRLPDGSGTFAATLLMVAFPVLAYVEPATASPGLLFGALFVLVLASAAFALIYESGWLHYGAAFFAVAAEAVWSGRHLTQERLLPGLGLYAAFGLLYLGVPIAARRWGRTLQPKEANAVVLLAGLALLGFLSLSSIAVSAVWGLALLLVILNAGLFLEAREGRMPLASWLGVLLSWGLIGFWWATVPLDASLIPALILVALFAVVSLAGNLWNAGRAGAGGDTGIYLALIGHLFLLFVATQPGLSVPPWPVLGVLGLLTLGAGVAALMLRRGGLHAGSLLGAQLVVATWLIASGRQAPWPSVALVSAAVLAAFGMVWIAAARRRQPDRDGDADGLVGACANTAIASLVAAQLVGLMASLQPGGPSLGLALPLQAGFTTGLLVLAWRHRQSALAPLSVLFSFAAAACWKGSAWESVVFSVVLLLIYLAYPLILGARAVSLRAPWLAAVLASAAFFLLNLEALRDDLGFAPVIGLLPVLLGAAMAVLLWRLLALEPEGRRDIGRIAMVAGAVLAFVTVAIPLQLEKQWITIGWALLAAALAWLYGRVPHKGLLVWTAGLAAAVVLRLSVNRAVLSYHPRAELVIWNWYLYTYLVAAVALLAAGWLLSKTDDRLARELPRVSVLAFCGSGLLLFLLLNIEIADYFSTGPTLTFSFLSDRATLAEGLTYTLGWGIFALALLVTGIVVRNRGTRVTAIALLVATMIKGFGFDLRSLEGLYRVASFVGMAVCLAAVAVLIQRFVLTRSPEEANE